MNSSMTPSLPCPASNDLNRGLLGPWRCKPGPVKGAQTTLLCSIQRDLGGDPAPDGRARTRGGTAEPGVRCLTHKSLSPNDLQYHDPNPDWGVITKPPQGGDIPIAPYPHMATHPQNALKRSPSLGYLHAELADSQRAILIHKNINLASPLL